MILTPFLNTPTKFGLRFHHLCTICASLPIHTVLYQLQMPFEEKVFVLLIFWSTFIGKSRKRNNNNFPHCPFELAVNQHSQSSPDCWQIKRTMYEVSFFSFPAFSYKSRPKYQKKTRMFISTVSAQIERWRSIKFLAF